MNLFPKVALNTLIQALGRVGVIFISILTTALLTRMLGISDYGNYVFIFAFVMLFVSISDWGTGVISVREAARDEKEEGKIFGNALVLRLLFAIMSFLAINLLIRLVPKLNLLILPTTIASFLLFSLSVRTSCQIVFQTKLNFEKQVAVEIFSSGLFLLLLLFFLKFFSSLEAVFFILAITSALGAVFALFLAQNLTDFDFRFEKRLVKKIFWESLPTGALLILFTIYNRIDIIILQGIKGSEPVGIYGLAYKIHENLILGAAFLMNALFPIISRVVSEGGSKEKLSLIYKKSFNVLFLAGIVLVFVILVFAPLIIAIIGGSEFSQSVVALRILVLATFVAYFNHLTGFTIIALGKQKVSLVVAAIALIWNVSLNLIFIPRYSYLAAALVTIATEGLVFVFTSVYLAKKFSLSPSLSAFKTLSELIRTRGKIF